MKEYLKKHLINVQGKRTTKKILVFESDDWGSIRIPNKMTQQYLLKNKLIKLTDPFSVYDCLENAEDYQSLFKVLNNHKDNIGNHPVITANMVMANPNFQKIKDEQFKTYHFEHFSETYESYYRNKRVFETLLKGIEQKFIFPQFHAREHLNVPQWLNRLQSGNERFLKAFELKCFAIEDTNLGNNRVNLMASYDYQNEIELQSIGESIIQGLQMFERTFDFQSKTTIAPCYVWNEDIENIFNQGGVKCMQSSYVQQKIFRGKHQRVWQKMGNTNVLNQRYFVRNVLFEPSLNKKVNWVEKAMESIAVAFYWGKPAIISSHRINFVAGLSVENRDSNLALLEELLKRVLKKWPEIEFVNSEELLGVYS
jgi:hypothetical protein